MNRPVTVTMLAMWTVAVLTAGAGAVAIEKGDSGDATSAVDAPPPRPTTTSPVDAAPTAEQIEFSGGVGTLELTGGFAQGMLFPVTFTPPERGSGNGAEIEGVRVGDELASIAWDAGAPLVVSGDGSFTFERVPISLVDGLLLADVGGATATISPGTFQIDTPVAVGRSGLAEPRDRVEFVVGATEAPTTTFRGDVVVELPTLAVDIGGPGGLTIAGSFTSESDDGTEQPINRIVVDAAADYEISLVPFAGGWIVEGRVPVGSITG